MKKKRKRKRRKKKWVFLGHLRDASRRWAWGQLWESGDPRGPWRLGKTDEDLLWPLPWQREEVHSLLFISVYDSCHRIFRFRYRLNIRSSVYQRSIENSSCEYNSRADVAYFVSSICRIVRSIDLTIAMSSEYCQLAIDRLALDVTTQADRVRQSFVIYTFQWQRQIMVGVRECFN